MIRASWATPTSRSPPAALAELIGLIESGKISGKLGKDVFARMWTERRRAGDIVAAEGLAQVSDSGAIEEACRKVVAANPEVVERLPRRQRQADGLLRGRGDEGDRRQGQPEDGQRNPATPAGIVVI